MPTKALFKDRRDAGRLLAGYLSAYQGQREALVLALPRGGVPVGYEVAKSLEVSFDIFPLRKLEVPDEELSRGAIAPGGTRIFNNNIILSLRISPSVIEKTIKTASEVREYPGLADGILPDPKPSTGGAVKFNDGKSKTAHSFDH